jgi:DNA-binding transcriptional ArsR family regulator
MTPAANEAALPLEDVARVLAEPTRLRILHELLGGVPLPAGALAARVGVAPSTTSAHLARLNDAGLIELRRHGRAHLASLTRPEVAEAVEALVRLAGAPSAHSLHTTKLRTALRMARSCYDHLAGQLGVQMADLAIDQGWVVEHDGIWTVPADGLAVCSTTLGLNLQLPSARSRPAVRPCHDWTERRPHLAGRLGAGLLSAMLDADWLRRRPHDRALALTEPGHAALTMLRITVAGPRMGLSAETDSSGSYSAQNPAFCCRD